MNILHKQTRKTLKNWKSHFVSVSKASLPFLKKKGEKPKGKTGKGKNKKHEVSFTSEEQVEIIRNDSDDDNPDTELDDKNDKDYNLGKIIHQVL